MAFTDQEIVEAIEKGKSLTRYVEQLHQSIYRSIRYYIRTNSGTEEDAQDIFQDAICTFVQMVGNGKFRRESRISTLLFSIAKRLWLKKHTLPFVLYGAAADCAGSVYILLP